MRRPSPAMVVALVALGVALGGTATAGTLISGQQVRDGSITGADVRNGSLTSRDFAPAVRRAMASSTAARKEPQIVVLAGSPGPPGPQGPAGVQGPEGRASGGLNPAKLDYIVGPDATVIGGGDENTADVKSSVAQCPPNSTVIGGGFFSGAANTGLSGPTADRRGWSVTVDGRGLTQGVAYQFNAFAVCAEP